MPAANSGAPTHAAMMLMVFFVPLALVLTHSHLR
jgi:hypothetical protein